jgi:hypothetical protein
MWFAMVGFPVAVSGLFVGRLGWVVPPSLRHGWLIQKALGISRLRGDYPAQSATKRHNDDVGKVGARMGRGWIGDGHQRAMKAVSFASLAYEGWR